MIRVLIRLGVPRDGFPCCPPQLPLHNLPRAKPQLNCLQLGALTALDQAPWCNVVVNRPEVT